MKRFLVIAVVIAVLVPIGIWWFSPEQVVMRRSNHLMEVVSIRSGTGGAIRQAKVFSMNAMLSPEVEMVTPDIADANGVFDKQEMESAFSWICRNAKSSDFRIEKFDKVSIEGDHATVEATVVGMMELSTYRPADGRFDVTIDWEKGGDGWRFTKIVWKNL